MEYVWFALILAVIVITLLAPWRFITLRSKGTPVLLRKMPAPGDHGWRHGAIRYVGEKIEYYKLRSLSPRADLFVMRGDLKVLARREPTSNEVLYMHPNTRILLIEIAGTEYELAFENRGDTAFIAWLESAPMRQVIRVNPRQAMRHFAIQQARELGGR